MHAARGCGTLSMRRPLPPSDRATFLKGHHSKYWRTPPSSSTLLLPTHRVCVPPFLPPRMASTKFFAPTNTRLFSQTPVFSRLRGLNPFETKPQAVPMPVSNVSPSCCDSTTYRSQGLDKGRPSARRRRLWTHWHGYQLPRELDPRPRRRTFQHGHTPLYGSAGLIQARPQRTCVRYIRHTRIRGRFRPSKSHRGPLHRTWHRPPHILPQTERRDRQESLQRRTIRRAGESTHSWRRDGPREIQRVDGRLVVGAEKERRHARRERFEIRRPRMRDDALPGGRLVQHGLVRTTVSVDAGRQEPHLEELQRHEAGHVREKRGLSP